MKIQETTAKSIKKEVKGLISDTKYFEGIESSYEDFRVFAKEDLQEILIMFKDKPTSSESTWSGHLYEPGKERLDIVEYGYYENVDIESVKEGFEEVEMEW